MNTSTLVCTPESICDPAPAIAAVRAGVVGLLDLGVGVAESVRSAALADLARHGTGSSSWGVRWNAWGRPADRPTLPQPERPEDRIPFLLIAGLGDETTEVQVELLDWARLSATRVLLEVYDLEQARDAASNGFDGVVLKGHEAGGRVGSRSSLLLLQDLGRGPGIPVWVQGAWGPDTAALATLAGAAGIVLGEELWLARESPFSEASRARFASLDGSETLCLESGRCAVRLFRHADHEALAEIETAHAAGGEWLDKVHERLRRPESSILPMGQGIAFAAGLARRHGTVARILDAFRRSAEHHVQAAAARPSLRPHGALAKAHGVRYPIVQGPMTRVSDGAPFCRAVADNGALPFLALALLRKDEARALLLDAREKLGDRPWGVGILGFVPPELRAEQLEAIREVRPRFGIIAGGRPSQAKAMEGDGISTYLHVPSPGLLTAFLQQGARKFIFEGRECGGHVGPRSSLTLWQSVVDVMQEAEIEDPEGVQVLFAGGIHDARSAAMVEILSVPLVERGMKVGVLMGTAYLFTPEAVATGAIAPRYQGEAIECTGTVLLESGVGHATRCAPTAFATEFRELKASLLAEGLAADEVRRRLELLNVGRLRIASKGMTRRGPIEGDPSAPSAKRDLVTVDESTQRREGMYMIGELAALRDRQQPMAALHEDVSVRSADVLTEFAAREPRRHRASEPIAIVGMACMFPDAADLRAYWANILRGKSAMRDATGERWRPDHFFDEDRRSADRFYAKRGGFLDAVRFDPLRYMIPPASLPSIEPAQLLALEVTRGALDDAGYDRRPLARDRASVIMGVSGIHDLGIAYAFRTLLPQFLDHVPNLSDERRRTIVEGVRAGLPAWTEDSFPGFLPNVVAGRIANRLDLRGANFVVDAACSSSLAAVHTAIEQLRSGTSDMVLAGAVDCSNNAFTFMSFAKTQALTPGEQPRPFDASADGIMLGEGVGVLVLKRLSDAERDGDRIYALIRGIGCSSDGRNKSLTAPFAEAQVLALRRAYEDAGVDPATVTLIEAHATGTAVGDRNEIEGLHEVFGGRGAGHPPCAVGSVKSMVGHTKTAAGVAGLIKAVLALEHAVLPPTLHVETPNPALDEDGPLYLNTETRPWLGTPDAHPRRAAVSAFGFGGTNFHVLLEEYTGVSTSSRPQRLAPRCGELFAWRGATREELARELRTLGEGLRGAPNVRLDRLAQAIHADTSARNASTAPVRVAIVATSTDDLTTKIDRAAEVLDGGGATLNRLGVYVSDERPLGPEEVCFLFPGQGAQHPGMLQDLLIGGPFDVSLFESVDDLLSDLVPGRLSDRIFPPPALDRKAAKRQQDVLKDTRITQPAVGAVDLFALEVLRRFGLRPAIVAGHSYGESVALAAAGVFTRAGLLRLSAKRGLAMHEVAKRVPGGMAAVAADERTTGSLLDELGIPAWIANTNAPRQTIIAGKDDDLDAAVKALRKKDVAVRRVAVSAPFHTAAISEAAESVRGNLDAMAMWEPSIPVYSNVTGAPYPSDVDAVRELLAQNVTSCVRFVDQIKAMHRDGARLFVEVGPGRILTGLVSNILEGEPFHAVALEQSGQPAWLSLGHLLARVHALGIEVDLEPWSEGRDLERATVAEVLADARQRAQGRPTDWFVGPCGSRPVARPAAAETRAVSSSAATSRSPSAAPVRPEPGPEENRPMKQDEDKPTPPPAPRPDAARLLDFQQAMMKQWFELQREQTRLHERFLRLQERLVAAQLDLPQEPVPSLPADAAERKEEPANAVEIRALDVAPAPVLPALEPTPPLAAVPVADGDPPVPRAEPSAGNLDSQGVSSGPPPLARFTKDLLAEVSRRTGYPEEMLERDLPLEAGLGIDSIKLMEIFSALKPYHEILADPEDDEEDVLARFTQLKTLRAILDHYERRRAEVVEVDPVTSQDPATSDEPKTVPVERPVPGSRSSAAVPVDRLVVRSTPARELQFDQEALRFPTDHVLLLVGDVPHYAVALEAALGRGGVPVCQVRPGSGMRRLGDRRFGADFDDPASLAALAEAIRKDTGAPVGGIINLLGLDESFRRPDLQATDAPLRLAIWLLNLAKTFESDVRGSVDAGAGLIVNLTSLDGCFGLSGDRPLSVAQAASLGFFKSLAKEWRGVRVKNLDFDPEADPAVLLTAIVAELAAWDDQLEVGINSQGRWWLDLVEEPETPQAEDAGAERNDGDSPAATVESWPSELSLDADSVILATGGAQGITAEVLKHLAQRTRATLVIVGRSPLTTREDEPGGLRDLAHEADLRRGLIRARNGGNGMTPARIEREVRRILKNRAIRENLEALRATGSDVEYHALDVRDEDALAALIEELYERHGRIDGVIHGAGVVEDRRLEDKTPESFARVFQTKVKPAMLLARVLRPDGLKFLAFFSSVSGRFGNAGQADYSAANECLNKLAAHLDRAWPGRVVALNWGPWDCGLISDALRAAYTQRGIDLIPVVAGSRAFVDELNRGDARAPEVVLACNARGLAGVGSTDE